MTILKPKLCMAWVKRMSSVGGVFQNSQRHLYLTSFGLCLAIKITGNYLEGSLLYWPELDVC